MCSEEQKGAQGGEGKVKGGVDGVEGAHAIWLEFSDATKGAQSRGTCFFNLALLLQAAFL